MVHHHHYTLEQAIAARAWVAERIGWVRDARAQLRALGPRAGDAVAALDLDSGGAYPGREVARALVSLSRAAGELEALDIVVRDVERGLIDFPGLAPDGSGEPHDCGEPTCPARGTAEGTEIYLCWLLDEEETIGFWHEPEAGFAGRRPI